MIIEQVSIQGKTLLVENRGTTTCLHYHIMKNYSSKHHDEAQNYTTSTGAYNWESVVSRSKAPCTAKETDQ